MSTTPAVAAAPAAGNGGTPPTKAKIETVPADIRRRALGMKPLPPPTAEETEAKKKEKEEADRLAKAKLDEEKKKTDEAAGRAAADAGATVDKVKKVKAGPPLPEAPTEQTPDEFENSRRRGARGVTGNHAIERRGSRPSAEPGRAGGS
jgi:hypothetical protein